MRQLSEVLKDHRQCKLTSCSPSLVEMILKLYDAVPLDYFQLQEACGNFEGLDKYHGKVIHSILFQKHDLATGQSYLDRIRLEFERGRTIGLYCHNKIQQFLPNITVHGWIVENLTQTDIHLASKESECGSGEGRRTITANFPLTGAGSIQITDLLFGTPQIEAQT